MATTTPAKPLQPEWTRSHKPAETRLFAFLAEDWIALSVTSQDEGDWRWCARFEGDDRRRGIELFGIATSDEKATAAAAEGRDGHPQAQGARRAGRRLTMPAAWKCDGCDCWVANDADGVGQQEPCVCGRHCWACCDVDDGGEWEGLDYGSSDDGE